MAISGDRFMTDFSSRPYESWDDIYSATNNIQQQDADMRQQLGSLMSGGGEYGTAPMLPNYDSSVPAYDPSVRGGIMGSANSGQGGAISDALPGYLDWMRQNGQLPPGVETFGNNKQPVLDGGREYENTIRPHPIGPVGDWFMTGGPHMIGPAGGENNKQPVPDGDVMHALPARVDGQPVGPDFWAGRWQGVGPQGSGSIMQGLPARADGQPVGPDFWANQMGGQTNEPLSPEQVQGRIEQVRALLGKANGDPAQRAAEMAAGSELAKQLAAQQFMDPRFQLPNPNGVQPPATSLTADKMMQAISAPRKPDTGFMPGPDGKPLYGNDFIANQVPPGHFKNDVVINQMPPAYAGNFGDRGGNTPSGFQDRIGNLQNTLQPIRRPFPTAFESARYQQDMLRQQNLASRNGQLGNAQGQATVASGFGPKGVQSRAILG